MSIVEGIVKPILSKSELMQYFFMREKIDELKEKLTKKRAALYSAKTPKLTGMPRGNDAASSKIEKDVVEVIDLEKEVETRERMAERARSRIEVYIAFASRSEKERKVLTGRCIKCYSFEKTADWIGEGMTADNARQIFSRHTRREMGTS